MSVCVSDCRQTTMPWIFISAIILINQSLIFYKSLKKIDFSKIKLVATNNLLVVITVMFNGQEMSTKITM